MDILARALRALSLMVAAALAALAPGGSGSSDAAAIQKVVAGYVSSFNQGDPQRLVKEFSNDAVFMIEGIGTLNNRELIAAFFHNQLEGFATAGVQVHLAAEVEQVEFAADLAFARATIRPKFRKDGREMQRELRLLLVLRKHDPREWKIAALMTNSPERDQPVRSVQNLEELRVVTVSAPAARRARRRCAGDR